MDLMSQQAKSDLLPTQPTTTHYSYSRLQTTTRYQVHELSINPHIQLPTHILYSSWAFRWPRWVNVSRLKITTQNSLLIHLQLHKLLDNLLFMCPKDEMTFTFESSWKDCICV